MIRHVYADGHLRVYEIKGWSHNRKLGHRVILFRRGEWYSVEATQENGRIFVRPRNVVIRLEGRPQYTPTKNTIDNEFVEGMVINE